MKALGPFSHVLYPASKAGKIYFAKDVEPYFETADFFRPGVGATVFRYGVLIQLAENEPDWDDYNGCPVIKMRPQSTNLCSQPLSVASASKVNVVIADNVSIREDGDAASEFFAFQDFSGFTELTKYTLFIEVEPIGGRNFRLQEGLGSGAISNINFNTETASDGELRKQSNGKFILKLYMTTAAGQTTIRFLMRILDASMGTTYDGDVNKGVNVTFRDIQLGHVGFDPIIGAATRSANSFTFSDLITKGAIAANGDFSILINGYLYNSAVFQGDFIEFLSGSNLKRIEISKYNAARFRFSNVSDTWFTPLMTSGEGVKPFVLTFNGSTKEAKVYFEGSLKGSTIIADNIESIKITAKADTLYDIQSRGILMTPIVLTESQAIAELNKL